MLTVVGNRCFRGLDEQAPGINPVRFDSYIWLLIPKIIHYIWIGDAPPCPFNQYCRESVQKLNPGFHFQDWSIRSIVNLAPILDQQAIRDLNLNPYDFYLSLNDYQGRHNPRALQADFLRTCILYLFGGIYLDWDLYGVQPLDKFLKDEFIFCQVRESIIAEAIMGMKPQDTRVAELLQDYCTLKPQDGLVNLQLTRFTERHRLTPYPATYFVPHDRKEKKYRYRHTRDTHLIHCWKNIHYEPDLLADIGEAVRDGGVIKEIMEITQ